MRILVIICLVFLSPKSEGGDAIKTIATGAAVIAVYNVVANKVAQKEYTGICSSPTGQWACPLAAAAAVGIVASALTAKKARKSEAAAECQTTNSCFQANGPNPTGGPNNNPNIPYPGFDPNNPIDREIQRIEREDIPYARQQIERLEREGYRVDTRTGRVTTPDGRSVSAGGAGGGLSSAGLSPSELQIAEDIMSEAAEEANDRIAKLKEMDEAYTGGGGSGGSNGYASANTNSASGLNFNGLNSNRNPNANDASIAGLSVNHGSDSIGVAGDNLFQMIERAYDAQEPFMGGP